MVVDGSVVVRLNWKLEFSDVNEDVLDGAAGVKLSHGPCEAGAYDCPVNVTPLRMPV